jgi:hypothetical protein
MKAVVWGLHAYSEKDRTNHLLIRRLKEAGALAFVIKVDKMKIVRRDIEELYNDLTIFLLEKVYSVTGADKVLLTASRKDTKNESVERFKMSLHSAYRNAIAIDVKRPREDKTLQAVRLCFVGGFSSL